MEEQRLYNVLCCVQERLQGVCAVWSSFYVHEGLKIVRLLRNVISYKHEEMDIGRSSVQRCMLQT